MTTGGIIAIVTGYVALAGVIAWLVYKVVGYHKTLQEMDDERDAAVAARAEVAGKLAAAEKQLADAKSRLAVAEEQRNKAYEDGREAIRKEVRNAPDTVAALNKVLAAAPRDRVQQRAEEAKAEPTAADAGDRGEGSLLITELR